MLEIAIAKSVESEFTGEKRFEDRDGLGVDRIERSNMPTCLTLRPAKLIKGINRLALKGSVGQGIDQPSV